MTEDRLFGGRDALDWLRDELGAMDLSEFDVPRLAENLASAVPQRHAGYFVRVGLQKSVRQQAKALGFIPNAAKVQTDTGVAPLARIVQLELPEIVAVLAHRRRQGEEMREAARIIADEWVAAHPSSKLTTGELMAQAGWRDAA